MNQLLTNIVPITKARGKLGDLAEKVKGGRYVVLTKGGKPEAALVDVKYLYQKTFIDPKLLPLTREFKDKEVADWKKEDEL